MRMIFHRICASIMLFGLISSCAQASDSGKKTTLFDGQVSFCYSEPLSEIIAQGRTGMLELDEINRPSLVAMNELLYGFKRVVTPTAKPKWSDFITGANLRWKRLCDEKLPKEAEQYYRTGRWMVDSEYDDTNAQSYPALFKKDSLNNYSVDERFWFIGDKLIHVEVRLSKKESAEQ